MTGNLIKYLFSVLSACYFIFAGTGYNIVDYCCDDCAREGIEFVAHHSCSTVHHQNDHGCCDIQNKTSVENDHQVHIQAHSHDNGCQIIRVQLDEFSVIDKLAVANHLSYNLFIDFSSDIYALHTPAAYVRHSCYSPPDIPLLSGRDILVNKSVLII
ncbi:MAG: hypothetical protein VB102_12745 [Paludibacter sp.]|nr:hypothetical protein [Paludibacter sp.]